MYALNSKAVEVFASKAYVNVPNSQLCLSHSVNIFHL